MKGTIRYSDCSNSWASLFKNSQKRCRKQKRRSKYSNSSYSCQKSRLKSCNCNRKCIQFRKRKNYDQYSYNCRVLSRSWINLTYWQVSKMKLFWDRLWLWAGWRVRWGRRRRGWWSVSCFGSSSVWQIKLVRLNMAKSWSWMGRLRGLRQC